MLSSSRAMNTLVRTSRLFRSTLASSSSRQLSNGMNDHHSGHDVNSGTCSVCSGTKVDVENYIEPWIPSYPVRPSEEIETKRSRLLYQSRKRGMLENDLLLSTFASKYLKSLEPSLLQQYDDLINGESNDWEIFYWINGQKQTPSKYENDIMKLLRQHAANLNKEQRLRQPDL